MGGSVSDVDDITDPVIGRQHELDGLHGPLVTGKMKRRGLVTLGEENTHSHTYDEYGCEENLQ